MSSVNNQMLVLADATSTWDTMKNGVVDAFNWVTRQVKWAGQSVCDFMYKIYEYVRPFFTTVCKFIADSYQTLKEFFMENKQASIILVAGVAIGAVLATVFGNLCFKPVVETKDTKETKIETNKT